MKPAFTPPRLTFNWARPPVPSLSSINFLAIEAVGKSECGAAGVVFLETDSGSFCVKACTETIATEYFSHLLFQSNRIPVPEILLIPYTSNQWNVIKNSIELATFSDEVVRRSIKSKLNSPMLMLMEYIPSLSITYMGPQKAERIFSGNEAGAIERLINLGRIFAMDVLINNSDRYPIIWDNNGNPENLLLGVRTFQGTSAKELRDPFNMELGFGNFVAIDSRVNLLDRNCKYSLPQLVKYEERINGFMKGLMGYVDGVRERMGGSIDLAKVLTGEKIAGFEEFKRLRKFIKKYSFYDIKESSEFLIILGILICFENVVRSKIMRIENLLENLKKTSKKWTNAEFIWEENLNKINLDFIQDIIKIIEENFKGFEATLKWVHELTGNRYFIDEKEPFDPQELINRSLKVQEDKEEDERFRKIANETAGEIEKIKNMRRVEEQKEILERKMKIKEIKAKAAGEREVKARQFREQKEIMERKFLQMRAANGQKE